VSCRVVSNGSLRWWALEGRQKLPIRDDGRRVLVDNETSTAAAVVVEISGDCVCEENASSRGS
jgi:hypothetical protein